jgi:hypothetical protein
MSLSICLTVIIQSRQCFHLDLLNPVSTSRKGGFGIAAELPGIRKTPIPRLVVRYMARIYAQA